MKKINKIINVRELSKTFSELIRGEHFSPTTTSSQIFPDVDLDAEELQNILHGKHFAWKTFIIEIHNK